MGHRWQTESCTYTIIKFVGGWYNFTGSLWVNHNNNTDWQDTKICNYMIYN